MSKKESIPYDIKRVESNAQCPFCGIGGGNIDAYTNGERFFFYCNDCNRGPIYVDDEGRLSGLGIEPAQDVVMDAKHYGGKESPYEVGKVLEAWNLVENAYLWNVVKYVARHKDKNTPLENLRKARFYLDCAIAKLEGRNYWNER